MEQEITKKKPSRGKWIAFVIIMLIFSFCAGLGGAVLTNFTIFPALADIPFFKQFIEKDAEGRTIFKVLETKKEIVTEDEVLFESIEKNQAAIVSVVSLPGDTYTIGEEKIGTGIIVSADGLILTNKHFVADPNKKTRVILANDWVYDAEVKARDPLNDLALLKIEGDNFPVANLDASGELEVGQQIFSLGNKYKKREDSVEKGILENLNLGIVMPEENSISSFPGLLETGLRIDSDNSGGPVFDTNGEILGLATSALKEIDHNYAIPISTVRAAIDSYFENGKIDWSTIGVNHLNLTSDFAQINHLPVHHGALLISSAENPAVAVSSPAHRAGLETGDIIEKINDQEINLDNDLINALQDYNPGDEIEIKYWRGHQEKTTKMKIREAK